MREVNFECVSLLRKEGYTFGKIGKFLGISKGVAHRIFHRGQGYSEKVGNKARGKIFPLWEYLTPQYIYRDIFALTMRECRCYNVPFENIIDYILDRLYSKDFSKIEKPKSYVYVFILKTVQHWASHHWREISLQEETWKDVSVL